MQTKTYIEDVLKEKGAHGFSYHQIKNHFVSQFLTAFDKSIEEYSELYNDTNIIDDPLYKSILKEKSTGKKLVLLLEAIRQKQNEIIR